MPIVDMLRNHIKNGPVSFHVPGHKGRMPFMKKENGEAQQNNIQTETWSLFQSILPLDVTELSDTDDLHDPSGAIAEAQRLAASCFGAEETLFLVGGSTAGNLALVLGCSQPGDIMLVQRNVHKSVLNGLKLSGASVVFLDPEYDSGSGFAELPSLERVKRALQRWPQAKAVFLSNPSYYGWSRELTPYAELVHAFNMPLLVDEAHGAHYGQHPQFPSGALQAGADAVVQSTHKTLSAMTMGAMLHVQGERLHRERIKQMLATVQSSSPSYPLMASLDLARGMLDQYGPQWFEPGLDAANTVRSWVRREESWFGLAEDIPIHEGIRIDPLRLVLYDRRGACSGMRLQKELEQRGCVAEMADDRYVVLLVGARCSSEEAHRLLEALGDIGAENKEGSLSSVEGMAPETAEDTNRSEWRQATLRQTKWDKTPESEQRSRKQSDSVANLTMNRELPEPVVLERFPPMPHTLEQIPILQAIGRKSAETIIPYPPGIPIVIEGEEIRQETAELMIRLLESGARFQGMKLSEKGLIRVTSV
ncbi:aminotransferase class I/II-fold pyridoxal phosphate-dependent enzyme [Paenibacillus pasadenensis]|nr:aminotransferase class I/II-fold pyridoxal phosphate-dependent enzyme [Paenibacillus pasadenensis]MCM3750016.1 aminotransferase class I/II-fold pyridoxal phosphate-dependent enzyme [Paenibacillus pasadenensis]